MDSFYITLPSNDITFRKTNTLASFKIELPSSINVMDYQVALSEITYTNSWHNVLSDMALGLYTHIGPHKSKYYDVSFLYKGRYDSPVEIVEKMNDELVKLAEYIESLIAHEDYQKDESSTEGTDNETEQPYRHEVRPQIDYPSIAFNSTKRFFGIRNGRSRKNTELNICMSMDLINYLGLKRNEAISSPKIVDYPQDSAREQSTPNKQLTLYAVDEDSPDKHRPFDIAAGVHSLYLYTDIIKHNVVGCNYSQLLRVLEIPRTSGFGDQVVLSYPNPHYFDLEDNTINTIHIWLKDDTGKDISFQFGKIVVVLNFRPKIKDV